MSATKSIHPDEKYKADKVGRRLFTVGLGAGAVFLVLSLILGASAAGSKDPSTMLGGDHWRRFFYAYVVGWSFIWSIAIGMLFFVLTHHLARAKWGIVLRRIAEFGASTLPLVGVLGLGFIIPVLAGYKDLYFWTRPEVHAEDHFLYHHLHHKFGWLSPGFFAGRYVLYFAIYSFLAHWFKKRSVAMDSADPATAAELAEKMRVWSGLATLVFALTTVFAGMDLLMSLSPTWYSTIYSVNIFAGGMLATYCTLGLVSRALQQSGRLTHSITVEHYHDIGKYMFGWTFFWIYTAFSQFMLQWYGNMPEETVFYTYRMFGPWKWVSIALLFGHWAFPYVCLVTRWTKRILPLLMFFAVWQLVFHWVDLYWNVMPNINWAIDGGVLRGPLQGDPALHTIGFSMVDITLWLAMVALFIAGFGKAMKGNLLPVKDPKLGQSLAFENY